jgi:uncharacterized damage-inducible protein DinB
MKTETTRIAAALFEFSGFVAATNTAGVTHEESLIPAPNGHNMNWVFGHVVAVRCRFLPGLGRESPWTEEQARPYRRGIPLEEATQHLPFGEIARAFEITQERILASLATLTEEDLAKPAPFNPGPQPETIGSLLTTIPMHDSYHLGQLGILRKVSGKEGAIR